LRILSLTQNPTRILNYLLHATSENMNMVLYLVHASRPLNLGRTFQISETCYKKCPQHSSSVIAHLPLIHLADCWPHALAATHLLCTDASRFHMFITSRLCPNITMQLQPILNVTFSLGVETIILRYEGPFVPVILFRRVVIVDLLKITNTGLRQTLCTLLRWTYIRYTRHFGTDSILSSAACLSRIC